MSVNPRVLYVDDEQENCSVMEYWLRSECGLDVTVAYDGKSALEHIDTEYFDIYLLDYCLPDTTGVELCRSIRTLDAATPIVIYSALDRDIDRIQAMNAGASCYLIKPDELLQLKPRIERLLEVRSIDKDLPRSDNQVSPESRHSAVSTDHGRLRRKSADIT